MSHDTNQKSANYATKPQRERPPNIRAMNEMLGAMIEIEKGRPCFPFATALPPSRLIFRF